MVNKKIKLLALLLLFIQFSTLAVIFLLALLYPVNSYAVVNVGLIAIALYILANASRNLKPSFRVNPIPRENVPLIRTGIYQYVRHPMYLAVILLALGISGFSSHPAAIVITGVLIINLIIKAKLEDNLLLRIHPELIEYQMNTARFIPCRCNTRN